MKSLVLLLLCSVVYAKHEHYAGWKSYYVQPHTQEQLKYLMSLQYELDVDFLGRASVNRETVVLVKPHYQEEFTRKIKEKGISTKVHVEDIVKSLRQEDEQIEKRANELRTRNVGGFPFNNYQRLAVFDNYLEDVARRFPDRVTLVNAANSFEGRPIKYVKISTTNFQDRRKPVIFIDGGTHAREWISPPTVAWAIHKLVENVTEPDLLERFDWILLPIVNPDGYEFSHTNERFWRKTRSSTSSIFCRGVDVNRNYDFFWGTSGSSSNPCADNFAGRMPFSEVETRVVRDIMNEHLSRIALYITMHSFGSMILYPWGHDGSLPPNALLLNFVGVQMGEAIDKVALPHFWEYLVGNSVNVIGYAAAGAAEDYAHLIGIPFTYTYELPGLGSGFEAFHLDPKYIEQVCFETWEGLKAGARTAGDLFVSS
ncbi:unnamed protein product [Chilo suppressalis]|uniref:Peptidase M14 domain-containing protein n=1 Tax=Chilo suppressalis TaxID=168631 RepID=A0ABN8L4M1_CHISP|nr:unnamed protein product [Chilo suppressalis]